jgi:hypothetical protein
MLTCLALQRYGFLNIRIIQYLTLGAITGIIFVLAADGNLWLIRTKFKIQIVNCNKGSDLPCALCSALPAPRPVPLACLGAKVILKNLH